MSAAIDEVAVVGNAAKRISDLVRKEDLSAPISHLGRWNLRDLVAHLGGVHRWAAGIVSSRSMDGPGPTKSKLDGTDLLEWFDAGARDLIETLTTYDRLDACPNFNPGSEKNVGWWMRRQAHETVVHRWDVEQALESTTPIDPFVAADGIDEFLDVFVRTRGKQTLIAPLRISTTDPARSWTLTAAAKPGRLDVNDDGTAPDTELRGTPEGILLVLWGRLSQNEANLTVSGDRLVADSLVPSRQS